MENQELLNALDNDNNKNIINLNSKTIEEDKNEIINELNLAIKDKQNLIKKLSDYIYIDDLAHIKNGSYIRWININNPENIKLTIGGLICDIKYLDNGCHILCKNRFNKIMQIKMEETLIFQKLNNQEKVILNVVDYLQK
jgi:hypothetical protein